VSFDPDLPLTHLTVQNATVVPFGSDRISGKGISRPAGVLDADGQDVGLAKCWRDSTQRTTTTPPMLDAAETLSGTWLYGGLLYAHFGHFLCESTSRLWALDLPDTRVEGVIFLPKQRVPRMARLLRPTKPWLAMTGCHLPVTAPMEPTRVERLIIPEQGFGTGDMVAGRPEYRAFARRNFGAQIAAEGSPRLYISRSRLFSKRGRILGEAYLERALAAEGYDIFHPQEHPIEVQVARYKAARQVISTDCSALHLAAFFAQPGDRVAIIARRPGPTIEDFRSQYSAFCGLNPVSIEHLTRLHAFGNAKLAQMSEVYAEADLGKIQTSLTEYGFVRPQATWPQPPQDELAAELAGYESLQGNETQEVGADLG
jgi:capsular polysaccharide biosynthesis protein